MFNRFFGGCGNKLIMLGKGEICLQKAVRFGSKNGLKRANLSGLATCRESNTCKIAFEKGVSKGPKGR